jgi:hypothetical protein
LHHIEVVSPWGRARATVRALYLDEVAYAAPAAGPPTLPGNPKTSAAMAALHAVPPTHDGKLEEDR